MLTVTVHQRSTNPQNPAPPTQYEMTPELKPFLPSLIMPQQNTKAGGGRVAVLYGCTAKKYHLILGPKSCRGFHISFFTSVYFEIIIYLKLMLAL